MVGRVHDGLRIVRVSQPERVSKLVNRDEEERVLSSVAEAPFAVVVVISGRSAPEKIVRTADCCAATVRVSLEDEGKDAAFSICVASQRVVGA